MSIPSETKISTIGMRVFCVILTLTRRRLEDRGRSVPVLPTLLPTKISPNRDARVPSSPIFGKPIESYIDRVIGSANRGTSKVAQFRGLPVGLQH